jgi:hypothetical protein
MPHRRTSDAGYATAEAAVVLPSLVLVLLLAVGIVLAVGAELRCVDASREAVRQAARGETDATARAAGLALAPPGSTVTVRHHDGWVEVTVRTRLQPWHLMPALTVGAFARGEEEAR